MADSESVVSAVVWNAPIEVDGRDTTDLPRNVVQCVSYSILKNGMERATDQFCYRYCMFYVRRVTGIDLICCREITNAAV